MDIMPEKKITPTDLRNTARELIRTKKMPTVDEFVAAMLKARETYVPALKKIREQEKEK